MAASVGPYRLWIGAGVSRPAAATVAGLWIGVSAPAGLTGIAQEVIAGGDEAYLMPRDKGASRRYTRDIVDSRRNFAGLFMPFAIVLIVVMFLPSIAAYANFVLLAFVVLMAVDAVILGRLVNKRVRERFPDTDDTGFRLGWYAFMRSTQLRRMRIPRPQVKPGDAV